MSPGPSDSKQPAVSHTGDASDWHGMCHAMVRFDDAKFAKPHIFVCEARTFVC